ncbi:MAG: hypothetical protein VW338_09695, partial [Rhodospirillaceae bacterium]
MDNIFMRRLWRSLKQEAVYLTELTDGFHNQTAIKEWVGVYTRIPLLSTEPRRKPKARPLLW